MEEINRVAALSSYLPTKPLKELLEYNLYKVTNVRKIDTKFGQKVIVDLDEEMQIFLPAKLNDYLIKNVDSFNTLFEKVKAKQVTMEYQGHASVQFAEINKVSL